MLRADIAVIFGSLFIFGTCGAAGAAEPATCVTSVRGEVVVLQYDPDDDLIGENYSWRERVFGPGGDIAGRGRCALHLGDQRDPVGTRRAPQGRDDVASARIRRGETRDVTPCD